MEISDYPIVDYLRLCLKTAELRGFLWVMVLLARERDLPNGYADIIKYWNSYDDLTGDKILFLLSASNDPRKHYEKLLAHETVGYKRVGNSSMLIVNNNPPLVSKHDYPLNTRDYWIREEAMRNLSLHISPVLKEFDLSENDIPAILLIPTTADSSPLILRRIDDVYDSLRSLIIHLEPLLKEYDNCKIQMEDKRIRKYMQSKAYVDDFLKEIDSGSREYLKSAIVNGDLSVCAKFKQPTRAHLNRLIDMQTQIREKKENTKVFAACNAELPEKKNHLNWEYKELGKTLDVLRNEIYESAREYCEKESFGGGNNMTHGSEKRFKIAFTFSGRYRDTIVRPVCEELLKHGFSKEDIFYDEWHSALINGIYGSTTLQTIYYKKSDFVLVLLSPDYREKNWTGNVEWPAVRELINTGEGNRICLLAVGDVELSKIEGLFATQAIYKPVDKMSPREVADFICECYELKTKGR